MLKGPDHYEVFVERIASLVNDDFTKPKWSWVRFGFARRPIDRAGDFESLEECFGSVREHAARCGKAPIKVNLNQAPPREHPTARSTSPDLLAQMLTGRTALPA